MLAPTPMDNAMVIDSGKPASAGGGEANGREELVRSLVRRYLLLSQVPASDWSRHEAALVLLSNSMLDSSLAPPLNMRDETSVVEAVQKRTMSCGVQRNGRTQECIAALQRSLPSSQLASKLYFLLRLSEKSSSRSGPQSSGPRMADLLQTASLPSGKPIPASKFVPQMSSKAGAPHSLQAATPAEGKDVWHQFHALIDSLETVGDRSLIRDLVYVLRGVDGTHVRTDPSTGQFRVLAATRVLCGPSRVALVEEIAQLGFLYRNVNLATCNLAAAASPVRRAFCIAVQSELRSHLQLIACLEATMASESEAVQPAGPGGVRSESSRGEGLHSENMRRDGSQNENTHGENNHLTLLRVHAWFADSRPRLQFLERLVCTETIALFGGPLLARVLGHQKHGDPQLGAIATRICDEMLIPYSAILAAFVNDGVLEDAHGDFFISQTKADAETVFQLHPERLIPTISVEQGRKVLLAGRTRAFLAQSREPRMHPAAECREPRGMGAIVELIDREHALACVHLCHVLLSECHLRTHLGAIRDLLHFGRGDFTTALMEGLAGVLCKPAVSLFRHAVVGSLDQALLTLGSGVASEVRDRLDVRLHDPSSANAKLLGWDVFTLDYRIDAMLAPILSPAAMVEHVRVSHFLWSLHRVHHVLSSCWRRISKLRVQVELADMAHLVDADLAHLQLYLQEGSALARGLVSFAQGAVSESWASLFGALDAGHPTLVAAGPGAAVRETTASSGSANGKITGLQWFVDLHQTLVADTRERLFIFSSSAVRTRLAVTLSALLRTESVCKSLERYVALCAEFRWRHQNHARPSHPAAWPLAVAREDEPLLHQFASIQLRMLTEYRVGFQAAVRTFHSEMDALLLQLDKESVGRGGGQQGGGCDPVSRLLLLIDWSGYHSRRRGFDQQKYSSQAL